MDDELILYQEKIKKENFETGKKEYVEGKIQASPFEDKNDKLIAENGALVKCSYSQKEIKLKQI